MPKYNVLWDKGAGESGGFAKCYDTRAEAEAVGRKWANESNLRDFGTLEPEGDCYSTFDVVEVPEEGEPANCDLCGGSGVYEPPGGGETMHCPKHCVSPQAAKELDALAEEFAPPTRSKKGSRPLKSASTEQWIGRRGKIKLEVELDIIADFGSEESPKDSDFDDDVKDVEHDTVKMLETFGRVVSASVTVLKRPPTLEEIRSMQKEMIHGK